MDLTNPLRSLARPIEAEVLRVLAGTTGSLSGRQVHQLAHAGSVEGVRRALQQLSGTGILHVERRPGLSLYRLNREHVMTPSLLVLLAAREELLHRITSVLHAWPLPLHHASVFGSTARADGDVDSDVDLLLVPAHGDDAVAVAWESAVDGLCVQVERWSGNVAHVQTVTREQLERMRVGEDPLVVSWHVEGRPLVGGALGAVMMA